MEEERQSALEMELGVALAEAADSVWIGPLPTAAVMAGGRRRRARRRAGVAALASLAVLLPAGGFAVAVATDGEKIRSADKVAARPAVPGLLTPVTVTLGTLKYPDGAVRKAEVTVYGAPRTKEESLRQIQLAEERGDVPRGWSIAAKKVELGSPRASDLHLGTMWYASSYVEGGERHMFASSSASPEGSSSKGSVGGGAYSIRGKHIGVWVGSIGSDYGAVEIGWGKQAKVRPRLISVPGVAEKFYALAMPEKAGALHMTVYDKEGKVVSRH
ncbi:hypothetical protein ACQEVG_08085 [Streptomyces sp. CA-135486]|uniref:hypothetical protein n=1 Tax=Streptomyces sp. CA-135486 TaxID=3240049 RepID=UPI003D8EDEAE